MENKKSLLRATEITITPQISIRIPTVGDVLDNEQEYYNLASSFTSSPFSCMAMLNNAGIDYTKITEYSLFLMMFQNYQAMDMSLIFGDIDMNDYIFFQDNIDGTVCLINEKTESIIDEYVYFQIADAIRKINMFKRDKQKPGNEEAKNYLLEKAKKKAKRHNGKKYESHLEPLVVALVNSPEYKYNYEETMDMSLYKFNQSLSQIQHRINFDKTMNGVYFGTVDVNKMNDKSVLSFIATKK